MPDQHQQVGPSDTAESDEHGMAPPHWSIPLLLLILALAALVQFTVVARSQSEMPMVSDAADYFSYAYNLKHFGVYSNALTWAGEPPPGGVLPDALRSPGYPLFLLAIPGLDASDAYLHRVELVQAALGVLSVWLVFLIGAHFLSPGWSYKGRGWFATRSRHWIAHRAA